MFTASLASMKREVNLSQCVDMIKLHVHGKVNTMLELQQFSQQMPSLVGHIKFPCFHFNLTQSFKIKCLFRR